MMAKEEAIQIAREFFEDAMNKAIIQRGMISERDIFCHENHVIVPWDSVEFLRDGEWEKGMIGNAPIRVDRETGSCGFIGVRQAVEYRKLGFPV